MRTGNGSARVRVIGAAFAALAAASVGASDPERGQRKSVACVACHGPVGISPNPTFPHIAGQHATYLQMQLDNFRSGERYHPLMTPIAQTLTDQDIADLAMYYSSIGPLAEAQR
ncbi:MAG: cytochrome c [Gammaproteobacteria bacterium]|nr:cytochrome c [Gammaproteobacteria bacterium]